MYEQRAVNPENKNEWKTLYPHYTCATDTNNIRKVFTDVRDTVLLKSLRDYGIIWTYTEQWPPRGSFSFSLSSPSGLFLSEGSDEGKRKQKELIVSKTYLSSLSDLMKKQEIGGPFFPLKPLFCPSNKKKQTMKTCWKDQITGITLVFLSLQLFPHFDFFFFLKLKKVEEAS